MSPLERRLWWLVRAYPATWRHDRGEDVVATALDLSRADQQWPSPGMAVDLVRGGWTERAHLHRREAGGWLAAGWRLATVVAVVVQAVMAGVWLQQWSGDGFVPMLPVLGAASAVTYVTALAGFLLATVAWLSGWQRTARAVSGLALASWATTVFVFQMALSGYTPDHLLLVAWTYLAVLATWALWHARPASPVGISVLTGALTAGAVAWLGYWGADAGDAGWVQGRGGVLLTTRGSLTAPFAVLGWAVAALGSLVAARRDPRPVLAVGMLLPLVLLLHPPVAGPTRLGIGALAAAVLFAAVAAPRVAGAR